jgi:2-dehydro-3-deoxygluconokinase
MTAVVVTTSAYGAGFVRQAGQEYFIPIVADAGAAGIEIRRELFTSDELGLERLRESIAEHRLYSVYSVPMELWREDGTLAIEELRQSVGEAETLGSRYLKISLGHYLQSRELDELHSALCGTRVHVLIENDQTPHGGTLAGLEKFFSDAWASRLPVGMTIDIGNWHWTGTDPHEAARRLGSYAAYVHCKGVVRDNGKLKAIPLNEADQDWRALFSLFPPGVQRAIEFPVVGTDLRAETRRYIDMLVSA